MVPLVISLRFQIDLSVINTYVICNIHAFFKVIIGGINQIILPVSLIGAPMGKWTFPVFFPVLFLSNNLEHLIILMYFLIIWVI